MNFADTEIINGILNKEGYEICDSPQTADAVFLNTCSIRDHAEQRIHGRLSNLAHLKKKRAHLVFGILGCMAERLRQDLLDKNSIVDIVCGPDEYRKLPALIDHAFTGERGIQVQLSRVETYDDVAPLRQDGISAWIAIMRGCDKFCSYCVVPFTRGRERSRSLQSIAHEAKALFEQGYRDITLLGQNVNSYLDGQNDFPDLLAAVAAVDPSLRVRFTTSHPQDMSDKLIDVIAGGHNICNFIHLPVQSGSDRILEGMNRSYSSDEFIRRIDRIRAAIPTAAISTDFITGFPTETEADHRQTLAIMERVKFDSAFMFKYSPRENTRAWKMGDDVPEVVKGKRLEEVIDLQRQHSFERNRGLIGSEETILLEGPSKRSADEWMGRTDSNKPVIVPKWEFSRGDYLRVRITSATSATLFGEQIPTLIRFSAE